MSQWMLTCSSCGKEFSHSLIPENRSFAELELIHKPEFPSNGLTLDCPHCGISGTYQRCDLVYSSSDAARRSFN